MMIHSRLNFHHLMVTFAVFSQISWAALQPKDTTDTPEGTCTIKPQDESFAKYLDDARVVLFEFHFKMFNYTVDPLYNSVSESYRPWRWFRTQSQHGRTLLMLSFHYDVLSMTILTIGVKTQTMVLKDSPAGCFENLTTTERIERLQSLMLDGFRLKGKSTAELEQESHNERTVYICNEVVKNANGFANYVNRCCYQKLNGETFCTDEVDDAWVTLLYVCITLVKLFLFFFSPFIIPIQFYSAAYVSSEYVVKPQREIKMKMYITESSETSVRYRKRLTMEDISEWRRFREKLDDFPEDEIVPIKIPELRIKVKGKRVIPENEPPTGLMRTLYDNLIRCKIKSLDPFTDCCDRSIYASLEPQIRQTCTWHMFVQVLVKVLLLFLVPLPFYIRVFIFYQYEQGEKEFRDQVASSLGLQQQYNFYRSNIVQYYTPTHGFFIAVYVFYFLAGAVIGFSDENVREKLKSIVRSALQDMQSVSRTNVLQVLLRIGLWPFKKCGLLAIILGPFYAIVTAPFCILIFSLYCIPTIYVSYRLLYHSRKRITYHDDTYSKPAKPINKRKEKMKKVKKRITTIDRKVHSHCMHFSEADDITFPYTWGFGKLQMIRRVIIQIIVGLFCLACLYSMVIMFVESMGFVVEVLAFTMMGIIVNAGSTLRYVSMAVLVIVYMHDCYNNVYDSYLTFNKTIIEDVMDRVEDLKKVASLPSSMQENAGFQVKPVEIMDEIPTGLTFEKKDPQWRIGHLLLFLDSFDTPRIPLRLFKKLCEVRIHGAPGPVYINLLRATGKFLIIVVFLFFVMIVVMAFGNTHQISSTNQTLATLAGGFVPMLLKNVLPRKSVKLNLKTLSFKGQIDEIIAEFKQNWPIQDLIVEKDEPEEDDNASIKSGIGSDKENLESRKQSLTTICEQTELGKPHGKSPNNEGSEEKEKEKSNDKKDGGDKKDIPIEKVLEKYIKDGVEKRNFLEKQELTRDRGSNGIPLGDSTKKLLPRLSIIEDNFVDLFIDLGVADAANHWHIYGSSETIPSASMLPDSDTSLQKYRNTDYLPPPYTSGMQEIPEIKVDHVD